MRLVLPKLPVSEQTVERYAPDIVLLVEQIGKNILRHGSGMNDALNHDTLISLSRKLFNQTISGNEIEKLNYVLKQYGCFKWIISRKIKALRISIDSTISTTKSEYPEKLVDIYKLLGIKFDD